MSSTDPTLLTGLGAALSLFLSASGSAYATAHASVFAIRHTDLFAIVPVIQAGVLAVYGIIIGYLLCMKVDSNVETITSAEGFRYLSAGLCVGLSCLASGTGMGLYLKQLNKAEYFFVRKGAVASQDKASKKFNFTTFVLCLIFLEAIGLYGLIVALFFVGK